MNATTRYMKGAVSPGEVYTLAQLEALPTLSQGQADDLKVDEGDGIHDCSSQSRRFPTKEARRDDTRQHTFGGNG